MMMSRRLFTACALAVPLSVLAAGCGDDGATGDAGSDGGDEVTVELEPLGDDGVSGTATLTDDEDGGTRVVVALDDEGDTPRPAHLHPGTCDDLDPAPKYPLEDVSDGRSETVIDPELDELLGEELALNVHESADNIENYIACGNLPGQNGGDGAAGGGAGTTDTTGTTETAEGEGQETSGEEEEGSRY